MPPKEIQEDFMETLGKGCPSYSTVKKSKAEFKRGERALRLIDGLAAPMMPPLTEMSRTYTPWLCVIRGEICEV